MKIKNSKNIIHIKVYLKTQSLSFCKIKAFMYVSRKSSGIINWSLGRGRRVIVLNSQETRKTYFTWVKQKILYSSLLGSSGGTMVSKLD